MRPCSSYLFAQHPGFNVWCHDQAQPSLPANKLYCVLPAAARLCTACVGAVYCLISAQCCQPVLKILKPSSLGGLLLWWRGNKNVPSMCLSVLPSDSTLCRLSTLPPACPQGTGEIAAAVASRPDPPAVPGCAPQHPAAPHAAHLCATQQQAYSSLNRQKGTLYWQYAAGS